MTRKQLLVGAAILLVGSPATAQTYRTLTVVKELRLDGHELDLVPILPDRHVAVARDGTLAIAQSQDNNIRFFSASGAELGTVGRVGAGPGEFRNLNRIGWLADTLWVYDARLERFTLLAPNRAVLRQLTRVQGVRTPGAASAAQLFPFVFPLALYRDGSIMGSLLTGQNIQPEFKNVSVYGRVKPDGIVSEVVVRAPYGERIEVRTDGAMSSSSHPFEVPPLVAVSPDGTRIVYVHVTAEGRDAGTFTVLMKSATGESAYVRKHSYTRVPIPRSVGDSAINHAVEEWKKTPLQTGAAMAEAYRKQARVPAHYPPFLAVLIGTDGTVWLEERATAAGRPYLVLDAQGAPVGRVMLPANAKVAVGRRNAVWTVERDEFDVGSVVRYRITNQSS